MVGAVAIAIPSTFMRFFPTQPTAYELIFKIIIYLGLVEFLGIIFIHVWKYILCNFTPFIYLESQCNKYKMKLFRDKKSKKCHNLPLAASYENFQEELLALSPGYWACQNSNKLLYCSVHQPFTLMCYNSYSYSCTCYAYT